MTSDILANALLVPLGASPESPPAGTLPEMPENKTEHNYANPITHMSISHSDLWEFGFTFSAHGEFIEEI